jgi:hypothetical protein
MVMIKFVQMDLYSALTMLVPIAKAFVAGANPANTVSIR